MPDQTRPDQTRPDQNELDQAATAAKADPDQPKPALRTDGPTLKEYTDAGYSADTYPPHGYALREESFVGKAVAEVKHLAEEAVEEGEKIVQEIGNLIHGPGTTVTGEDAEAAQLAKNAAAEQPST